MVAAICSDGYFVSTLIYSKGCSWRRAQHSDRSRSGRGVRGECDRQLEGLTEALEPARQPGLRQSDRAHT